MGGHLDLRNPSALSRDLGGSENGASFSSFIPAFDYVPSFHGTNRNRGDESWNERVLVNPATVLLRER